MKLPSYISTGDADSFAQFTVINRLPGIVRSIAQNNSLDAETALRLEELAKAMPESPLEPLPATSGINIRMNDGIRKNAYRWNNAPFIFIENYLYHLLCEIMDFKNNGKDYFSCKKNADVIQNKNSFVSSIERIDKLIADNHGETFRDILYLNILGNKADLSQIADLRNSKLKLLIDDTEKAVDIFRTAKRIDFVLDNSGEELFSDILLVYFLFCKTEIEKIVLHFKTMPYFVSDALKTDFHFLLDEISASERGKNFADTINQYIQSGRLLLCDDTFWNDTDDFRDMPPHIRIGIDESDLVIFKGDLNYRKLVEDRHWDFSAKTADLAGYMNTNCLIIRVLKSELITGLDANEIPDLSDKTWMYNGEYGLIQTLTAACR